MNAITRTDVMSSTRLAGAVKRYHTWPVIQNQRNDSHSWQVMRIYVELFGAPRSEVWQWMLYHDAAEIGTGDVPGHLKEMYPALGKALEKAEEDSEKRLDIDLPMLSAEEFARVKLCDTIERVEFGLEELRLGNKYAEPVISGAMAKMNKMLQESFPDYERVAIAKWVGAR